MPRMVQALLPTPLEPHHLSVRLLCEKYRVARLEIFGSVLTERFTPISDVDFLVWFQPMPPIEAAEAYFGLWFGLEDLLAKKVDLVMANAIQNPYFDPGQKKLLYAA
jgi:uncharacterized protein